MEYCVVTFHSVHDALYAEQLCKEKNLALEMIPVPREISSTCGIAARLPLEKRAKFEQAVADYQLPIKKIHVLWEKLRS